MTNWLPLGKPSLRLVEWPIKWCVRRVNLCLSILFNHTSDTECFAEVFHHISSAPMKMMMTEYANREEEKEKKMIFK